jgi:hypothetical protein
LKAKKHGHILATGDASELLTFSDTKRRHVMESLVCLSKFQGSYNVWKEIKERYQLKWTAPDALGVFQSIFSGEDNYTSMLNWLKTTISKLPSSYSRILIYGTLTGLRPTETFQSIGIIQSEVSNYLNRDNGILEHYKFPSVFIRNSKKAFISIVNENIIQLANESHNCGYNALRNYLVKRGLELKMGHCRKIFATYLRLNGIELEVIDLLQGRIPKSVFVRHYFRPDFQKEKTRISECLVKLHNEITQ